MRFQFSRRDPFVIHLVSQYMVTFRNPLPIEFTLWILTHSRRGFVLFTKESYFSIFIMWFTTILFGIIMKIIMAPFLYHTMWRILSHIILSIVYIFLHHICWRLKNRFHILRGHYLSRVFKIQVSISQSLYSRCTFYPHFWRWSRHYPRGVRSFFSLFLILIYFMHTMRALYVISVG